jgi:hypothetical protein
MREAGELSEEVPAKETLTESCLVGRPRREGRLEELREEMGWSKVHPGLWEWSSSGIFALRKLFSGKQCPMRSVPLI